MILSLVFQGFHQSDCTAIIAIFTFESILHCRFHCLHQTHHLRLNSLIHQLPLHHPITNHLGQLLPAIFSCHLRFQFEGSFLLESHQTLIAFDHFSHDFALTLSVLCLPPLYTVSLDVP